MYGRRIVRRLLVVTGRIYIWACIWVFHVYVLGHNLRNILYDGMLRLALLEELKTVAYADNLAVIVKTMDKDEVMERADEAMRIFE